MTAFGARTWARRRAPAEVRRAGPASPRRRDPRLPGPRAASSGSGWPRCRSSTRTGSWTSFTSPATATRDYARHLRDVQAELHRGLLDGYRAGQDVLVFAAHLYVQGAIPSYTERPVDIEDTYLTEADALPPVSYAALGHIHRPQAITRGGMHGPLRRQPAAAGLRGGRRGQERRRGRRRPRPPGQGRPGAADTPDGGLMDFTGTLDELRAQAGQIGDAFVRAVIVSDAADPAACRRRQRRRAAGHVREPSTRAARPRRSPSWTGPTPTATSRTCPTCSAEYLPGRVLPARSPVDILATFADLLADTDQRGPRDLPARKPAGVRAGPGARRAGRWRRPLIPARHRHDGRRGPRGSRHETAAALLLRHPQLPRRMSGRWTSPARPSSPSSATPARASPPSSKRSPSPCTATAPGPTASTRR